LGHEGSASGLFIVSIDMLTLRMKVRHDRCDTGRNYEHPKKLGRNPVKRGWNQISRLTANCRAHRHCGHVAGMLARANMQTDAQ